MDCRFCQAPLTRTFVDLGASPLANSYLRAEDLTRPEVFYPLHTYVCDACYLVQLPMAAAPEEIFSDYAYFSSFSDSWLRHAESYATAMVERFSLGADDLAVEIASNDGYLLRYLKARGVQVLGVEPAANVAQEAEKIGIPSRVEFFGSETAEKMRAEGLRPRLMTANNVLAHTPYLNDFVRGISILLADDGVATLEFPHLQQLVENNQFDTIYHEHYSYFSFTTVREVFAAHGLVLFDVEEWPTHGGSLRIFAQHEKAERPIVSTVPTLLEREETLGYQAPEIYESFGARVRATKRRFLEFLIAERDAGRMVAGYGAPAKGNTLLNYCGVRSDLMSFTVDRSPHKQGLYLPGTRIPILSPDDLRRQKPDIVVILPWNLREEIADQMKDIRDWGGRFAVAIPEVEVF